MNADPYPYPDYNPNRCPNLCTAKHESISKIESFAFCTELAILCKMSADNTSTPEWVKFTKFDHVSVKQNVLILIKNKMGVGVRQREWEGSKIFDMEIGSVLKIKVLR
jgi:hypothetical protein